MKGTVKVLILMVIFGVQSQKKPAPYQLRWLGISKVDNTASSVPDKMVIHCYPGKTKTIDMLWRTVVIRIFIQDTAFKLHVGITPEEIYDNRDSWQSIIRSDTRRTLMLNPFNQTCVYVETEENYSVQVFITDVDRWRVVIMLFGILLVFSARTLSRNPAFFYLFASIFGVLVIILVTLYYLSRQSILKTGLHVTLFFGGWTTLVYYFQHLFDISMVHNKYILLVAGFISFLIAYRIGPPQSPRTKNIMMWVIQGLGAAVIIYSSWHEDAAVAVFVMSLGITYLFRFLIRRRRTTQGTNEQVDQGRENNGEDKV